MKIVTIACQKGGVGRTTTVVNLSHALALRGKSVLIVDLDPQGQVAISLGITRESGIFEVLVGGKNVAQVIRETHRRNLWLVPGDKRTATAQITLPATHRDVFAVVNDAFAKSYTTKPDFVIFDTASGVGGFQEAAMTISDLVIVTAATDHLALFGVSGVLETLTCLSQTRDWYGKVLLQPTFFDGVTKESQRNLQEMVSTLRNLISKEGDLSIMPPIHRTAILRAAATHSQTIFEFAPNSRPAKEYATLMWRVLEMLH